MVKTNSPMRKVLLFSLVFFSCCSANAGDKSKSVDLTGNWKEIQRMTKDKTVVGYTDTIRIEFMIGNEFVWQKAGSFMFKGTYKATAATLDLGSRYFTVVESSSQKMLLKDDNGFYQLMRYKKEAATENNSNAQSSSRSNNETSGDIELASFNGNWETYKRTTKTQQQSIDYDRILKRLKLTVTGKNITGEFHAAREMNGIAGWHLDKYEKGNLYFSGKDARKVKVLKCADGELILEEGDYTYFLKKFK
jgi:hypothetical protein